jgi:CGNR zinc finger
MAISNAQRQHIVMSISNSSLTVRPKILFCVAKRKTADRGLRVEIYGQEPPTVRDWKEFTAKYMALGTRERKQMDAELSKEDKDTLSALPLLRRAASIPENRAVDLYDATRRLIHDYPKNIDMFNVFAPHDPKKIMRLYAQLLNDGIKSARLVVTTWNAQPTITVFCRDLRTAAFVYASFGGLEVCPGCDRLFAPNPRRESQLYCSKNCGQRIYQREFRKRQKSKAKSKRRR